MNGVQKQNYWSDFRKKTKIKENLYWSAIFHSIDQRKEDLYYYITLYKRKGEKWNQIRRFGVRVMNPLHLQAESRKRNYIHNNLSELALKGKTNIPASVIWEGITKDSIDHSRIKKKK